MQNPQRQIHDRQVPHSAAVLRTPPHERPLSPAAARFVPAEPDPYDRYVEPSEAVRAACARARARGGDA